MPNSLQDKTIDSMLWCTVDRVGSLSLAFISNLVLARLLLPHDFGCIAMLNVFLSFASILMHGGFTMSLIQKNNPTAKDYSSVFYCNLAISTTLYAILFFTAPAISRFYHVQLLTKVLRVQALQLIIDSFSCVQLSILKKNLRFKSLAFRNILSTLFGVLSGVLCAFYGCGVWSLVVCSTVTSISGILLLWRASSWRPTREFSMDSIRELFSFGGFMMLSSIVSTLYENLQSLLIGKFYSSSDLGYVNQAKKLESVPSGAISSVVSQVSFPVFSSIQTDTERLRYGVRKNILAIEFVNIPLMLLLVVIARPLILFLYGQKWELCVPYFQILCISRLVSAIVPINQNLICARGQSKQYLLIQLLKCFIAILLILATVRQGIIALMWALTIIPYIEFIICSIVNRRKINYGLFEQVKDILPILIASGVCAGLVWSLGLIMPFNQFVLMFIDIAIFLGLYLLIAKEFRFESFDIYYGIIRTKLYKRK